MSTTTKKTSTKTTSKRPRNGPAQAPSPGILTEAASRLLAQGQDPNPAPEKKTKVPSCPPTPPYAPIDGCAGGSMTPAMGNSPSGDGACTPAMGSSPCSSPRPGAVPLGQVGSPKRKPHLVSEADMNPRPTDEPYGENVGTSRRDRCLLSELPCLDDPLASLFGRTAPTDWKPLLESVIAHAVSCNRDDAGDVDRRAVEKEVLRAATACLERILAREEPSEEDQGPLFRNAVSILSGWASDQPKDEPPNIMGFFVRDCEPETKCEGSGLARPLQTLTRALEVDCWLVLEGIDLTSSNHYVDHLVGDFLSHCRQLCLQGALCLQGPRGVCACGRDHDDSHMSILLRVPHSLASVKVPAPSLYCPWQEGAEDAPATAASVLTLRRAATTPNWIAPRSEGPGFPHLEDPHGIVGEMSEQQLASFAVLLRTEHQVRVVRSWMESLPTEKDRKEFLSSARPSIVHPVNGVTQFFAHTHFKTVYGVQHAPLAHVVEPRWQNYAEDDSSD